MDCLRFTLHWVWPASRCGGAGGAWRSVTVSLGRVSLASSLPSLAPSSSDDGGFLPRLRAPLHPAAAPPLFRASSPARLPEPASPASPLPRLPAWTPWSPLQLSDLSSVPFPSSADNSYPTPPFVQFESRRGAIGVARRVGRPIPRHSRPPPHEASPESRSSSSGFGSKNASSSQQNRSSRPGSAVEWRPPPYRPPPPPAVSRPASGGGELGDAGSVDVHYEWDRATRTPTRTPTPSSPERRATRSRDEVEARVRAMKEEFMEFRKRQALRRRSPDPLAPPPPLSALPPLALALPPLYPAETVC